MSLLHAVTLCIMCCSMRWLTPPWLRPSLHPPHPSPSSLTCVVCDHIFLLFLLFKVEPWLCSSKSLLYSVSLLDLHSLKSCSQVGGALMLINPLHTAINPLYTAINPICVIINPLSKHCLLCMHNDVLTEVKSNLPPYQHPDLLTLTRASQLQGLSSS